MRIVMIAENDPAGVGSLLRDALTRHTGHDVRLVTTQLRYNHLYTKDLHVPWLDAAGPLRLSAVAGSAPPRQPDVQVDQVGLGIGAVSRIHDAVSQNFPDSERWQQALDAAGLPVWRGHVLDADEQLRMDVIGELLRTGAVSIDAIERRYGVDFHQYFSQELERLHGSFGGLIASTPGRLAATSQGHLALRIMAACFDRTGARPPP